jgi:hypothetical protein
MPELSTIIEQQAALVDAMQNRLAGMPPGTNFFELSKALTAAIDKYATLVMLRVDGPPA